MEKVEALADACTRGGMPTHALEDARGAQWRKLIFNAASNAIAALTGLTHGRIAEPPTRDLAWAVMAEGRAVADAQGIVLDMAPEELFDFAARKEIAYDHKPSMLQDVEAGRQTEIDFLNGAIVDFGERYGVDAPLNRALTALVKGLERSNCMTQTSQAEIEQRYAAVRRAAAGRRSRRGRRLGVGVHGLRGRRPLPVGLPHPPPLRLRRRAGRRRSGDRVPARGALGRRPRRGLDGAGVRRASRRLDRRPGPRATAGDASASAGSTT